MSTHVMSYWVENFLFRQDELPDMGHEYTIYVLQHWTKAEAGSSLNLAVNALSHAVFGKTKMVEEATCHADKLHVQSIARTYEEMKDLNRGDENIDQLLLAIMLMSTYENIMYGNKRHYANGSASSSADAVGSRLFKSICHIEGASGLLKTRRENGSAPNLPLDKVVRRQIVRTCILRGVAVPKWLRNGAVYGEKGPSLALDVLMVRVAALRAKTLPLFLGPLFPGEKESTIHAGYRVLRAEAIAVEARELDDVLASWSRAVPEEWSWTIERFPTTFGLGESDLVYDGAQHVYTSHAHATIWDRCRAARLIVNSIRIRALQLCLDFRFPAPSQGSCLITQGKIDSSQKNIDELTNDICGSVPFFFHGTRSTTKTAMSIDHVVECRVKPKMAGLLAWPLTVAISTDRVLDPQRQWLKARLKEVAISYGDSILESVVEKGEFRF